MNPDQRQKLRTLIDEWYQLILDGKPGAAVAAKKLAVLAHAHPSDYARLACSALEDAGLGLAERAEAGSQKSAGDKDGA